MTRQKFETLHEAFEQLAEKRAHVDRLAAADLPRGGLFAVSWKMISQLIDLGLTKDTERAAGNLLEMVTEELPSAMNYAEIDADRDTSMNAAPTVTHLEQMLELAKEALGENVYQDMSMDVRRPPSPRRAGR